MEVEWGRILLDVDRVICRNATSHTDVFANGGDFEVTPPNRPKYTTSLRTFLYSQSKTVPRGGSTYRRFWEIGGEMHLASGII